MAIEIIGKSTDVERYREFLHNQGLYTKNFLQRSGMPISNKPDGFRFFTGGIKSVYNLKGEQRIKQLSDEEKLYIKGIANANMIDRCDERLEPAGIDIENFMKNPVLLLDHMYTAAATVGRVISLDPQDSGVHFEAYIGDPKKAPLTPEQKNARSLVAQQLLQTVSVGFIPHKIKAPEFDEDGRLVEPAVILNWELLELSIVAVPANAGSVFDVGNLSHSLNEKKSNGAVFTQKEKQSKINLSNSINGVHVEKDAVTNAQEERQMEERLLEMLEEMKKMSSLLAAMSEKIDMMYEMEDDEEEQIDEEEKMEDEDEDDEKEKMEDEDEDDEEDEDEAMKMLQKMVEDQNEKIETLSGIMLNLYEKQNG